MKLENWLARKYQKYFDSLVRGFTEHDLQHIKDCHVNGYKYVLCKLIKDIGENKKGDLAFYHRSKEYYIKDSYEDSSPEGWTGNFEYYFYFAKNSGLTHNPSYVNEVMIEL